MKSEKVRDVGSANWWSLWAPIGVSVAFALIFIARTSFVVAGEVYFTLFDDAMISMRYARNLADGHGLVWNPGQPPVEGYTNFLWTLWMAVLHLLPVPESKIALLVMITGMVLLVVNLLIVRLIAARLAPGAPLVPALAVWLTVFYYPLTYWTLRGMEVGLITLIVSTAVLVALRLRDRFRRGDLIGLGVLMALGILTRPDVIIPCVLISGFVLCTVRPEYRRVVALVLASMMFGTLAVHTAFRVQYYGSPLPNTYYLKVQGASLASRLSRGLFGLFVLDLLHLIVPVALWGVYLRVRDRTPRGADGAHLLAAIFVALCAYSVYVGGDAWDSFQYANRYVTPAIPGLLILAALGIDGLLHQARGRRSAIYALALVFLVVGVLSGIGPVSLEDVAVTPTDEVLRMVRTMILLTPIVALPLLFSHVPAADRRLAWRHSAVGVVLLIASIAAIDGQAASLWLVHNARYVDDDVWATRYGLALRAATTADATIAVTWAGAIPYFSRRPAIDLLGKSDPVVATRPRQPIPFSPGHDKWDYRYSIGQLRPDVVAELWHASESDVAAIESWGYVRVAPWVFVRADSARVDRSSVKATVCTILRGDPFLLGSPRRFVPDVNGLAAPYCR